MTVATNNHSMVTLPHEILGVISNHCQDPENALAKTNKQLYNTKDIWSYRCSDIYSKWLHTATNTHPIIDGINQNRYQKKLILHIDTKRLNFDRFKEFLKIKNEFEIHIQIDEKGYDKLLRLVLKTKDCNELIQNIKTIHFDQTTQTNPEDQDINCASLSLIQQSFPAAENFGFSGRVFIDTVQRIQQSDFSRLNELKIQTIDETNFLALIAQALQIKKLMINYLTLQRNSIQNIPILPALEALNLHLSTDNPMVIGRRVYFNDIVLLLEKIPRIKSLSLLSCVFDELNPQNQMLVNNVRLPFLEETFVRSYYLDSHYLNLLLSKSPKLHRLVLTFDSTRKPSAFAFNPHLSVKKIIIFSKDIHASVLGQFLLRFPNLETLILDMHNSFVDTDFSNAPRLPHLKTIFVNETSSYPRIQNIFRKFTRSYRILRERYPRAIIIQTFSQRPITILNRLQRERFITRFSLILSGLLYLSFIIYTVFMKISQYIQNSNTNSAMMLLNRIRQLRFAN